MVKVVEQVPAVLGDPRPWVLVAGPASTKKELVKHTESHRPELRERILVEPADHMSDGQIADHALQAPRPRVSGAGAEWRRAPPAGALPRGGPAPVVSPPRGPRSAAPDGGRVSPGGVVVRVVGGRASRNGAGVGAV